MKIHSLTNRSDESVYPTYVSYFSTLKNSKYGSTKLYLAAPIINSKDTSLMKYF